MNELHDLLSDLKTARATLLQAERRLLAASGWKETEVGWWTNSAICTRRFSRGDALKNAIYKAGKNG